MTALGHPSSARRQSLYLAHCMRVSVVRRWHWLLMAAIVALGLVLLLQGSLAVGLVVAVLAAGIVGGGIALNSWQRHSSDFWVRRSTLA